MAVTKKVLHRLPALREKLPENETRTVDLREVYGFLVAGITNGCRVVEGNATRTANLETLMLEDAKSPSTEATYWIRKNEDGYYLERIQIRDEISEAFDALVRNRDTSGVPQLIGDVEEMIADKQASAMETSSMYDYLRYRLVEWRNHGIGDTLPEDLDDFRIIFTTYVLQNRAGGEVELPPDYQGMLHFHMNQTPVGPSPTDIQSSMGDLPIFILEYAHDTNTMHLFLVVNGNMYPTHEEDASENLRRESGQFFELPSVGLCGIQGDEITLGIHEPRTLSSIKLYDPAKRGVTSYLTPGVTDVEFSLNLSEVAGMELLMVASNGIVTSWKIPTKESFLESIQGQNGD